MPKYDIIAAMTGCMLDDEFNPVGRFIDDIVAAVRSDSALLPDPIGQSVAAARGRWVSDNSFEVERRILGHSETQRWFMTFEGNNVTIHFVDTDGDKADVHGRAN